MTAVGGRNNNITRGRGENPINEEKKNKIKDNIRI